MLSDLLKCLDEKIMKISVERWMDVGFCLFHHQAEDIEQTMNKCFGGVTAENVEASVLRYLSGGVGSEMVYEIVKLYLRDSAMDATDDEVRAQIVERATKISHQLSNDVDSKCQMCAKKQFLNSQNILRDISLEYVTNQIGGTIYVDVGGEVAQIKQMLTPPSSATHVLFGAGLKGECTLKLAVVARKEDIFNSQKYPTSVHKAMKVRNFYTYYDTKRQVQIGFSGEEKISLMYGHFDSYDHRTSNLPPESLDDHRLCILINSGNWF